VAEALIDHVWVSDIKGALSWHDLMEYLELWDTVFDFQLNTAEDEHSWKHESSDIFSSRSTYKAFFVGATQFEHWKRLWKA